jgi:hypothetical protein
MNACIDQYHAENAKSGLLYVVDGSNAWLEQEQTCDLLQDARVANKQQRE